MKKIASLFLLVFTLALLNAQIPHLSKNEYGASQMIVKGKPFLMLGGELYNSSASNITYLDSTLKKLKVANLNTVFVPISWELIEPTEGKYNLTSIDAVVQTARKHQLKLVILWLATWKNGTSPYAPIWLMKDTDRFWRVKNKEGKNTQTLSAFCKATLEADKKAYQQVMKHLASIDSVQNTVLAMQVENEVGVFAQTRDFSDIANNKFREQVPAKLINYLQQHETTLELEIKTAWKENGSKTSGTWAEVFGKSDFTDLYFMAWYYASYINEIAETGKKIYALPTYANCWMPATPSPNPRPNYTTPGTYPSGGPIIMVFDVWKAAAPAIDILSPDLYGNDFDLQVGFFHRYDNPLFIPETKAIAGRASFSYANYAAICFSPFGIDNQADSMKEEYALLSQMSALILQYQGSKKIKVFYRSPNDTLLTHEISLNDHVTVKLHLARPYLRRDEEAKINVAYGLFIQTNNDEFIVAGKNIYVSAFSTNANKEVWLRDVWEGNFINGKWVGNTLHNGDEAGFLWSKKTPVYRIQTNPTISPELPTKAAIFKFNAMQYNL